MNFRRQLAFSKLEIANKFLVDTSDKVFMKLCNINFMNKLIPAKAIDNFISKKNCFYKYKYLKLLYHIIVIMIENRIHAKYTKINGTYSKKKQKRVFSKKYFYFASSISLF